MEINYAKTLLYAYPVMDKLIEQTDALIEKKALASMNDCSPCEEQCERIIQMMNKKDIYLHIRLVVDEAVAKLTEEERQCVEYKYFKNKPKEYFTLVEPKSRNYFRKQKLIAEKICVELERLKINDEWFEKKCLVLYFFKKLLSRVIERETAYSKGNRTIKIASKKLKASATNSAELLVKTA